jgi:predicted nuclease with TOPRIM domain
MNDQQKAWLREQRAMEMRMWYGVRTQEELLNKLKMNKIVVSKECVDNYEKYKDLQKKLTELKDQLEKVNRARYCDAYTNFISHMEKMYIADLYRSNKQLIDKTLNQEVQRLEQELDNYIVE